VTELIQQYLLLNKTVSIKGWGTLKIVPKSAELEFANRLLHPPSTSFEFSKEDTDDPLFLHWLSTQLNTTVETTIQKLNLFTVEFKQSAEGLKTINWLGWGVFGQTKDGILTFIAEPNNNTLLEPVTAERVIRKGVEHSVRVGEDERTSVEMEELFHAGEKKNKPLWLAYALLLLIIGIILAGYFATNYNLLWNHHTNYQQLQPKEPPVLYKKP
jgi:hypothetical protein